MTKLRYTSFHCGQPVAAFSKKSKKVWGGGEVGKMVMSTNALYYQSIL